MERRLPWFIRLGDRLVNRHERWVREYHDSGDYYLNLLCYANERDEHARERK